MDNYLNFFISRKQAQSVAFSIVDSIEEYVNQHQAEFLEFLGNENSEKKGGEKNE